MSTSTSGISSASKSKFKSDARTDIAQTIGTAFKESDTRMEAHTNEIMKLFAVKETESPEGNLGKYNYFQVSHVQQVVTDVNFLISYSRQIYHQFDDERNGSREALLRTENSFCRDSVFC